MTILIFVALLTLFISANCSLYEAILYSTRAGALEAAKAKPAIRVRAQNMLEMKKNISSPIAAILILNTVANTAGATVVGMYADRVLPAWGVILFSALFTSAILLFAEIMPKTAGAVYWRTLWPYVVFPVRLIRIVFKPIVLGVQYFSSFFDTKAAVTITEEEILALVKLGAREGELSREEGMMVNNIIKLDSSLVRDVMTPRTVIFSLDVDQTIGKAYELARDCGFSRLPVYSEITENIIGYVLMQDLEVGRNSRRKSLKSILRSVPLVQEDMTSISMLMSFLKKRNHLAIVKDEFGGTAGVVTMEDIIETILGAEIVDETDRMVDTRAVAKKTSRRRRKK